MLLASLRDASKSHYVSAFDMAAVFASMGEKDNAFHWLEKAYSERESQMAFLGITRRMTRSTLGPALRRSTAPNAPDRSLRFELRTLPIPNTVATDLVFNAKSA